MIKPTKYLNLKYSLLNVSSEILKILSEYKVVKYYELYERLIDKLGSKSQVRFSASLSFLYALGKIKYHKEIDSIEFVK